MHAEDAGVNHVNGTRRGWHGLLRRSWTSTDLVYLISRKVLLAYALLVGSTALLFLAWEIAATRKAVEQRHAELHRSVESVLSESLWTFNEPVIESAVSGLVQDAAITGARVHANEGGIDFDAGTLTRAAPGWSGWMASRYVSRWPVTWSGERGVEQIGVLEIETSERIIRERIVQQILLILLFSALALGSLFGAFLVVIRRHVVAPLSSLAQAMGDFRLGEASRAADPQDLIPGEIGRLYKAFRVLDTRLQAAHGQLTASAQEMQHKLAEQAASLDAAHRRNMGLEVSRAQELERRRLMRDMHDGFGSELVSARIAAERGNMAAEELAAFLTKCIADLQLMINVTGTEAGNLSEAIADWRYRVSRQLSGEQFRLVWNVSLPGAPTLPQRVVLQILRIAQEAVFNATRHSGAREIRITAQWTGEAVELSVTDDGCGFDPDELARSNHRGKGLASMGARARELGATLTLSFEGGSTVRLTYRPEPEAQAC